MRNSVQDLRLQADGSGRGGIFRWGRTTHPNKPNRFKFWWVNQIDGFRPKQTQGIYLPCCQLDTTKFGPVFEKNGWSRPIKDLVPNSGAPERAGRSRST